MTLFELQFFLAMMGVGGAVLACIFLPILLSWVWKKIWG